jgi:hypothetical protein
MFYIPSYEKCKEIFFQMLDEEVLDPNDFDKTKAELKIHEIQHDILLQKIKIYEMIVRELVDTVHSAYLRAFNGGERESLRTARMVTQNANGINPMMPPQSSQKNKFKWYNPTTWSG